MAESNSKTLYQALWNCADILRSKMDANEYKSYLLGLVFYKYLSDKLLLTFAELLDEPTEDLIEAQRIFEREYTTNIDDEEFIKDVYENISYIIKPELTFTYLVELMNTGEFHLEYLAQGLSDIQLSSPVFANLFEDIDLFSKKLGNTPQKQNQTISGVMKELANLDLAHSGDVLGDAYEYLIGQFASDSGKKAGEFYTPQAVSTLMTRIVLNDREDMPGFSVYDPTMGSGSLLLNAKKYSNMPGMIQYFGQELNTSTYNLARMNMILHGVPIENQHLHNADTLDQDWPTEEPTNFDAVLMNPPYSAKWGAEKGFLDDPRFFTYGVLAPKSKADFAFLLHGYYHLKDTGVMAIVLPHGVLFRGNAEGKIRKVLLENGAIDTVIGLPANIFFNTSIPTTVIILKKNRTNRDVLFIDASNEFTKGKNQNLLEEGHIQKILDTYKNREDVDKYAHVASFEEIKENDFNLNIPRYVDTFEEEEPIDIIELSKEIISINKEIEETEKEFLAMLDELQVTDETRDIIEATKAVFKR
ncbi:type I restriction-modification system subunit M [Veillonella criceti]|uniref:site-specific DNA-methyltransferase (adenine-specific) n=1 Tax=Veillonella criceti TaxID=103891 RepID=A0A380NI30_9FIRM|nr:type I restriction-modification system subunit M [Veillonella criceti]SUP41612.1 Probable type I restriction enzyme BthVORF4518P M protein [Veillonella criceti]SUP79520.1 Probable type I restriction enzyme BthVORF4518P M protein [Veillonella criceti]